MAGVAGLTAVGGLGVRELLVPDGPGAGDVGRLRLRPLPAAAVADAVGVAAHPTFRTTVYGDVDAWVQRVADLGLSRFRGLYDPANPGTADAVAACRRLGIGWIMLVVPESGTGPTSRSPEETAAVVERIGQDAADVCVAVEGVNEPNHDRNAGTVADGWAEAAVEQQRAIWTTVRATSSLSGVEVIGPSLHDVYAMRSYREDDPAGGARHWDQLADAGLVGLMDRMGLHFYPAGRPPADGLEERLDLMRDALGADLAVHVTETGYHDALVQPTNEQGTYEAEESSFGHAPTAPAAAGVYAGRAVLEMAERGLPWVWYELLDDPVEPPRTVTEAAFGLYAVGDDDPATWTAKPAAGTLRDLLARLREAGGEADSAVEAEAEVDLEVTAADDAALRVVLTRGGDGALQAHCWRDLPVWDPIERTPLDVAPTPVVLTYAGRRHEVDVGPGVGTVDL